MTYYRFRYDIKSNTLVEDCFVSNTMNSSYMRYGYNGPFTLYGEVSDNRDKALVDIMDRVNKCVLE